MKESTKQRGFERWFDERHFHPSIFQDEQDLCTSSAPSTSQSSTWAGLFDLPRELRDLIYIALWSLSPPVQLSVGCISFRVYYPSDPVIREVSRKHAKKAAQDDPPRPNIPGGLLANKRLLSEALEELNRLGIWKAGDRSRVLQSKATRGPDRMNSPWVKVQGAREMHIHLHTLGGEFERSRVVTFNSIDRMPMTFFTGALSSEPFANLQVLRLQTQIGRHAIYRMGVFSLRPLLDLATSIKLDVLALDMEDLNMYVHEPPNLYHQASSFRDKGWFIPPERLRRGGLNHGEGLEKIEDTFKRGFFSIGDKLVGGVGKHIFERTDIGWRFEVRRLTTSDAA